MSITKLGKGLIIVASAAFLFACASKQGEVQEPVEEPVVEDTVTAPIEDVEPPEVTEARINAEARQARTIYFDLDDDTVNSDGRALLEKHAWFLAKNPSITITIEGHCDERGTPAYNLALGERRAKAIAQILMLNEVSASQIKTVSKGEEVPAVDGHDESAWSQNRRGILDYEG
ncbi:peptidoglycan-associated lipoprotein Pal [Aliikangiella sp. IMCC44359]|uniref:peptidoglycan-associated lipoprotein Pal n=1 Tax=Aliikangiella sp. IMCC44359 TaxID=3459125 RepID=UPI00403AB871